jgi:hypothetical protein
LQLLVGIKIWSQVLIFVAMLWMVISYFNCSCVPCHFLIGASLFMHAQ